MFKKLILSSVVIASVAASLSLTAGSASAQEFYGQPWHHHHHNYGGLIAGGIAAGLVGGILSNALVSSGDGYYEPAPPQPECWYQRQSVQDRYDDGYHYENVRVCN